MVSTTGVTLETIRAARERIAGAVVRTPCTYSLNLSRLCGCEIYCKLDHMQVTGSFKERGARNKLSQLSADEKKRGVIAASAGNHALGLAYHGQELGIPVTVVMPRWAPLVKVTNCRSFHANVIQHGETFDEARQKANQLAHERNLLYVHGFDDPDIIAGQGTMGLEILEDVPDVDAVVIPVGGGGLISGVGSAIKAVRPETRIIGVESRHAPTLHESIQRNEVTKIEAKPSLADGLAVAEVGKLCFALAKEVLDELVLVDEVEIARSILKLLEHEKMVIEGAGAVPLAAVLDRAMELAGKKVVLCLCGGNIDVTVLSKVIERGLAADGRLCRITVQLSDRPGSLAKLLTMLAATGASVKEVNHDREFGPADVALVSISCILETRDFEHISEIERVLRDAKIPFTR